MDPNTGLIYDRNDPNIPEDVRQRLIEVPSSNPSEDEMRAALRKEFVETQTEELSEILDEMERVKILPNIPAEEFYLINRAARRKADKRNRALKKRDKRG